VTPVALLSRRNNTFLKISRLRPIRAIDGFAGLEEKEMTTIQATLITLFTFLAVSVAQAQTVGPQQAADGWRSIPDSWNDNYSIQCSRGGDPEPVLAIHPGQGTSDWNVAQDIFYKADSSGRIVALSFQRGFVSGIVSHTITLGADVSCNISKQR
jgi:hypothetical protein